MTNFKTIHPKPGIYPNVDPQEYFALDAVNQTSLKTLLKKSPAEAKYLHDHGIPSKKHLIFGQAAHMFIADDLKAFRDKYIIVENSFSFNAKVREKETFDQAEAEGKQIIKEKDMEAFHLIYQNLHDHEDLQYFFRRNPRARHDLVECGAVWNDPDTGLLCKAMIDRITLYKGVLAICDFKTIGEITDFKGRDNIMWSIYNWGYHIQAAWYMDGFKHAFKAQSGEDIDVEAFILGFVGSDAPHIAAARMLGEKSIEAGRRRYRGLIQQWASYAAEDFWPTDNESIKQVDVPDFEMEKVGMLVEREQAYGL